MDGFRSCSRFTPSSLFLTGTHLVFCCVKQEEGAASLGFALSLERMVPRLEAALSKL